MAKYFLSNKAVEDLSGIWEYTYEAWSERQADKYYELLIDTFNSISQKPEIGKAYVEIASGVQGHAVGKHIVFYRAVDSGQIEILRILHQRMDLKSRMGE